ncbi:MAG: DUF4974 domain-containing protein [Prolixibacteraceae bacterium]|nr:DUF4974 domain-containing protein [Prolixibacteraceae bacterium]
MLTQENYNRYKKGNYSKDDFEALKKAMQDKKGRTQLDVFMREDWLELNNTDVKFEKDLQYILHKIHYIINDEKPEKYQLLRRLWYNYSRIAAVLLIAAIVTIIILYKNDKNSAILRNEIAYSEIHTPLGSRSKFHLPDGTTGWLNTGSVLKYQIPFKNNRHVLLNGEAFFDVVHDEKSPFTVEFSGMNVHVLGTSFNVMAFEDDAVSEVILVKGKVEITDKAGKFSTKLDFDQKFSLDKNQRSAQIENIDAQNYVAWKEGKLIFRNEPLPEVAKRLGRWYNVEFVIKDKELNDIRYRATFVDEQLSEILRLLSLSAPISYKIEDRIMNNDNEFLKKKVILTYNKNYKLLPMKKPET